MAGQIEFNEPKLSGQSMGGSDSFETKIIKLIISLSGGLVKDEKQAKVFLAVVFAVIILISVFLLTSSLQSGTSETLTGIPA